VGSADRITGSIKSKMAGGAHLGMTALSRVTLASAGLCFIFVTRKSSTAQAITHGGLNYYTER